MDFSANRYSSQWEPKKENGFSKSRKFKIVGEPLNADWVDIGFGIGTTFPSEQEAKKEIQEAISAFERDISEMKRGKFSQIYGEQVVDKADQLEIIGEYENLLKKIKKWKVEPVFGG